MLVWFFAAYLILEFWFFDWLSGYVEKDNCLEYSSIKGTHLLFYGLFVIVPLASAFVLFLVEGRRSIRVIKLGQNPLPGEKVLRPTKYKYGNQAKVQPFAFFAAILFLVGVSVWGGFQAYELTKTIKPCAVVARTK
jgi:hypothetical protein